MSTNIGEHFASFLSGAALAAAELGINSPQELLDQFQLRDDDHVTAPFPLDTVAALQIVWAGKWRRSGCPVVRVSRKLTAYMASTSMPSELADDLCFPWPSFAIAIEDSDLFGLAPSSKPDRVQLVTVTTLNERRLVMQAVGHETTWSAPIGHVSELGEDYGESHGVPLEEQDFRMLKMAGRILVGVCIELSSVDNQKQILKLKSTTARQRRLSGAPVINEFVIGRDVRIDCGKAVREYVDGSSGRSVSVRTLVRGHWKRQRHGAGSGQVKWIQVAPYWRGPLDAPIALRSHVFANNIEREAAE